MVSTTGWCAGQGPTRGPLRYARSRPADHRKSTPLGIGKHGVASAVNGTSRAMGGALGIAVAGSILAGRYSHELAPRPADFPAPVRGPAADSLAKAVEVAGKLGPQGRQLPDLSKDAFITALHASTAVMAVIVAIAAFLIGLWAPGRDGRQLPLVRRILAGWRIAGQPMPSTAPAELQALPQQKDCCTFQAKPPR
jgi:hypothetical protein